MDIDQNPTTQDVDMEGVNNDYSMSTSMSITPPEINVVDFAYSNPVNQDQAQVNQGEGMVYHSAPTSPRGTRMDTEMSMNTGRALSAEPSTSITQMNPLYIHDPNQNVPMPTGMGMGVGTITPIPMPILGDRKPSLFTLMNSRPNTPSLTLHEQSHFTQRSQDSPTLFDGLPPISTHHPFENIDRERRMSLFGSMQLSSLPNAGGVGRLSLSKGSEGIGLGLGLEHVS
jgi:hypothetical protein